MTFNFNQSINHLETYEEINNLIGDMLSIDENDLEKASLDQNRIFTMLQRLFSVHTRKLEKAISNTKKVELHRWKYYTGALTSEEYKKEEPLRVKPLKSDVDKYLKIDDLIIEVKSIESEQDRIVKLIEDAQKERTARGFNIKNILEYKKFMAGG